MHARRYWVVLCVAGLVLMVGMFIGVFQDGFIRQRRSQRTQEKLFERVGAIAAFSLLDVIFTRGSNLTRGSNPGDTLRARVLW